MTEITPHRKLDIRKDAKLDEAWLQEQIARNPQILQLGDLRVKDRERRQPAGGRLDMLLRDPETEKRYVVELMLGDLDESHVVRTIEYWATESKRNPRLDHVAAIAAERISGRMLKVLSILNGPIPLVVLKLDALDVAGHKVLNFTIVMDEVALIEDDDEDEPEEEEGSSRQAWEARASPESMRAADSLAEIIRTIAPSTSLNFKKNYIGILENGRANNFVVLEPKPTVLRVKVYLREPQPWIEKLESAGIPVLRSQRPKKRVMFQATSAIIDLHKDLIRELFAASHAE